MTTNGTDALLVQSTSPPALKVLAPSRISDLPTAEKPRERLQHYGAGVLSTAELLAILVRTGTQGASALEVGQQLVNRFGLAGLVHANIDELCAVPGCGPAKAIEIKAALELGRRLGAHAPGETIHISAPADAAGLLMTEMSLLEQEHLRVVLLNTRHHVMTVHEVYKGSVSTSQVRIAEVFREAVRRNCPSIIVVHNHPSGDPTPSRDDIHLTRQLVGAGKLLEVSVIDHLIIGAQRWISLREKHLGFD